MSPLQRASEIIAEGFSPTACGAGQRAFCGSARSRATDVCEVPPNRFY